MATHDIVPLAVSHRLLPEELAKLHRETGQHGRLHDLLDGADVLPGFQVRLQDLLDELADDEE
jgi:hypothetical protein